MAMQINGDVGYTIGATDVSGPAIDSAIANQHRLSGSHKTMADQMQGGFENLKRHWMGYTAVVAAASIAVNKAWGMAKVGADFDEQRSILTNLGRKYELTADQIVTAMDRASDNQISNANLMNVALGGLAKGLNPDQLIKLAEAANVLGDTVGKTATEALKDLTEALETGRTRGLKTYLGTTLDLRAAFGDLESKMTEVEKSQAMYALTMQAMSDIQARTTTAVDGGADAIARVEKKFDDATLSASRFFKMLVVGFIEGASRFDSTFDDVLPPGAGSGKGPAAVDPNEKIKEQYQAQIDSLKKVLAAREENKKSIKDAAKAQEDAARELKRMQDASFQSYQKGLEEEVESTIEAWSLRITMRNKEAEEEAKLRDKLAKDSMAISEANMRADLDARRIADELIIAAAEQRERSIQMIEAYTQETRLRQHGEFWAMMMEQINQTGEAAQGLGMMGTALKGQMELGTEEDPYTQEMMRAYEHYMQMKELYWADYESRVEVSDAWNAYEIALDREKANIRLSTTSNMFKGMAGMALAFYQTSQKNDSAWFKVYKAFAIGMAIIDTYRSGAAAWRAGWEAVGSYYYKAALAIAGLALAVGTGMAQVNAIQSASPTGGSGGSTGTPSIGSVGAGYSYGSDSDASWRATEPDMNSRAPMAITIQVYGDVLNNHDELARKLIEPIKKAYDDGVQ